MTNHMHCDNCERPIIWARLGEQQIPFDESPPTILGKKQEPPAGVDTFVIERGVARAPTADDKRLHRELHTRHGCGRRRG